MRFSASEGFGDNNKDIIVLYISLKVTTFVVMRYSWLTNRKQRGFRDRKEFYFAYDRRFTIC